MSIKVLQARLRNDCQLRMGEQRTSRNGKKYPAALNTWRFTSIYQEKVEQAAAAWGGQVTPWDSPNGPAWQVTTDRTAIDVILLPGGNGTDRMGFSQWLEMWDGAACRRRCDGVTETIGDTPCLCDPDNRECDPHTRLDVLLPDIPSFGMCRVVTTGMNAAVELAGTIDIASHAADRGVFLPARLIIEPRSTVVFKDNGDKETRRFVVPVLDLGLDVAALTGAPPRAGLPAPQGVQVEVPPPTPIEAEAQAGVPSVAEQLDNLAGRKARQPTVDIPPTGIDPETGEISEPDDAPEDDGMAPRPSETNEATMRRRLMAEANKTWPGVDKDLITDYRHALAFIVTRDLRQNTGQAPTQSVNRMTMAERLKLSTYLTDVRRGAMTIEAIDPDDLGRRRYHVWISGGHRVATLTRLDDESWDIAVAAREPEA